MTRVLGITNMFPPHHYGGYELICRDVLARFGERGHETAMLTTTMRVPGVAEAPDEAERRIWRRLRFAWDDHQLPDPSLLRRVRDERHNHRVLAEVLDSFRPEVVSVWNMGAMSLGLLEALRRRGVPVVLNLCDDWLVYGPSLDPWMRLFADRPGALARAAEALAGVPARLPDLSSTTGLFISEFTRRRSDEHARLRPGRSSVTWSGIDERDFPVSPREEPSWSWRLLGVGRVDERKGIDVAIRALAALPEQATLRWVGPGDGAERARLESLAAELGVGDRVTWGAVERSDLPAEYARADVFVFPSTWAEPFGLVPIEAMACGVPVVGSGSGGSSEFMLHEQTALLAERGSPEAMAAAVHRLAEDRDLRQTLVAGGAAVAAELTIGNLVDFVEAWHLAAAAGFPDGEPAARSLLLR